MITILLITSSLSHQSSYKDLSDQLRLSPQLLFDLAGLHFMRIYYTLNDNPMHEPCDEFPSSIIQRPNHDRFQITHLYINFKRFCESFIDQSLYLSTS